MMLPAVLDASGVDWPVKPTSPGDEDLVVSVPPWARDLAGFRTWIQADDFPEQFRITYLQGEVIVDTSQEELTTHALVKTELVRVLASINVEEDLGMVFGDGARVTNAVADVSNIPDTVFVAHESMATGAVKSVPRPSDPLQTVELEGSPDLVVEIVSNSSVVKDVSRLRMTYFSAGISEYWLIDARGAEIVFQILIRGGEGYVVSSPKRGWSRSGVFNREFRLTRNKNRSGFWAYRLETRGE